MLELWEINLNGLNILNILNTFKNERFKDEADKSIIEKVIIRKSIIFHQSFKYVSYSSKNPIEIIFIKASRIKIPTNT